MSTCKHLNTLLYCIVSQNNAPVLVEEAVHRLGVRLRKGTGQTLDQWGCKVPCVHWAYNSDPIQSPQELHDCPPIAAHSRQAGVSVRRSHGTRRWRTCRKHPWLQDKPVEKPNLNIPREHTKVVSCSPRTEIDTIDLVRYTRGRITQARRSKETDRQQGPH